MDNTSGNAITGRNDTVNTLGIISIKCNALVWKHVSNATPTNKTSKYDDLRKYQNTVV